MQSIREKEVLTSSTQDLRQNMIREKVPLQGMGDGVSRQWCFVVDFKVLPVLCSAPVPSCYSKLSVKSDTQSTLWPWCLRGNKDIWVGEDTWEVGDVKKCYLERDVMLGTGEVEKNSRSKKSMTVPSRNMSPEDAQTGWYD